MDSAFSSAQDSVKGLKRGLLGQEKTWQDEVGEMCPSLTYTQRFWGFGTCCALGFLLSMGSLLRFGELLSGNPVPFALTYSAGNILSIAGTSFIVGPCAQVKRMFQKNRWIASLIYITSIGVTLFTCLYDWPKEPADCTSDCTLKDPWVNLLIVAAVISQFLALLWYIFSYIPFARTCVTRCIKNCGTSCAEF